MILVEFCSKIIIFIYRYLSPLWMNPILPKDITILFIKEMKVLATKRS